MHSTHPNVGTTRWAAWVVAGTLLAGVLVVGCMSSSGQPGHPSSFPVPAGWHDITPPTSQYVAHYAISPDIPGLILGCIGDRQGDLSGATVTPAFRDAPAGPATLWRTQDGGTHWQKLALSGLQSGCKVTLPRGGKGTMFTMVQGGNYGSGTLVVSHDAGDTWQTVDTASLGPGVLGAQSAFDLASHGVYQNAVLYSSGRVPPADTPVPPVVAAYAFESSSDDGGTWRYVEQTYDPRLLGYVATSFTPDFRAPGAWFRLLVPESSSAAPLGIFSPVLLQHSVDGGQTWQVLGQAGLATLPVVRHTFGGGILLSVPERPSRLCFAWRVAEGTGVPVPGAYPPTDELLAGSDDDGASWGGAVIQRSSIQGTPPDPALAIDAQGNCYTATESFGSGDGTTPAITTRFFRLPPGAVANVTTTATLPNQYYDTFGIAHVSDGSERLVAAMAAFIAVPCTGTCAKNEPTLQSTAPHLLWTQV